MLIRETIPADSRPAGYAVNTARLYIQLASAEGIKCPQLTAGDLTFQEGRMGYRKAEKILPPEVVALIQQYVDGEYIYIPRKEENRKCWGESTDYRREMDERNRRIYEDYLSGMKTDTLSMKYFLTEKSIQRIIAKEKKRPA